MKSFKATSSLQLAVLNFIEQKFAQSKESGNLRILFDKFDVNGNGVLSKKDLANGYAKIYGSSVDAEEMAE